MCGIAGILSPSAEVLSSIYAMTDLLRHRGPDDEGYSLHGEGSAVAIAGPDTPNSVHQANVPYRPTVTRDRAEPPPGCHLALGHRRLSILDLSALGHQPMAYQNRFWIVFNGEIYNYLELRAELEASGCQFHSRTDTEVILAAYGRWGLACLPRFNGMWALALYDAVDRKLVLARDRFGVKPLYYWTTPECLAFASEIKAFACLPGWRPQINGQAVHDFLLSSLQDHSEQTMFAGVSQLQPGCCAVIDVQEWRNKLVKGQVRQLEATRWYQAQPRPFPGSLEDAAKEFAALLTDSVRLRLRADVPVGSCLSGGLDSSSIVCVANRLLGTQKTGCRQQTFSACSEIKRFDERDYIEKVVAATAVEGHYVFPSFEELEKILDRLTWHQDEPFGSTSIFAQWTVFKLAESHRMKVMLDGQGADELFYGYPSFRRAFVTGLVRSGKRSLAWREARALRGNVSGGASLFSRACVDAAIPLSAHRGFRQWRRNRHPPAWMNPEVLGASYPGPLAGRFQQHATAQELSVELISGGHLQMLLHWEDRNSMAHGVESRLPFLDYRLVEFALGLPDHFKIHQGWSKAVLRRGMKNIVPDAVLQRKDKLAFVTPEEIWVRNTGTAYFRDALAAAVRASKGILTSEAERLLEKMISGEAAYEGDAWRMISLGQWLQRFAVSI
jgi:asparagine synthase (glutamine-hydrolysing)